jgi:putative ABC transport system ATP-binding protein
LIPILEVHGLSYSYDKKNLFENISCVLYAGEMLLIQGASGSGKSTFLSLISACRPLQKGSVKIKGQEIFGLSRTKMALIRMHALGLMHQIPHVIPHFTVEENLSLPLWIQGKTNPEIKDLVSNSLKQLKIHEHAKRFPAVLSGGEQQRLSCARACITNPDLIIADEPTSHLDLPLRHEIWNLLHEHTIRGAAVIIVSHDPLVSDHRHQSVIFQDMGFKNKK